MQPTDRNYHLVTTPEDNNDIGFYWPIAGVNLAPPAKPLPAGAYALLITGAARRVFKTSAGEQAELRLDLVVEAPKAMQGVRTTFQTTFPDFPVPGVTYDEKMTARQRYFSKLLRGIVEAKGPEVVQKMQSAGVEAKWSYSRFVGVTIYARCGDPSSYTKPGSDKPWLSTSIKFLMTKADFEQGPQGPDADVAEAAIVEKTHNVTADVSKAVEVGSGHTASVDALVPPPKAPPGAAPKAAEEFIF